MVPDVPTQQLHSSSMESRARGAVLGLAWAESCGGRPGQTTWLSLALAGALLERSRWSLGAWVCWLLAGQRFGVWRGGDRFLNEALMRLRRGEPPERTGFPTPRLGPAARVGTLGVLLRGDPPTLLEATMQSTLVTHADLRAGALAFAVAYAVARLVDGDEAVDVVGLLPDAVRGAEDAWSLPRQPLWERDQGAPHAVSEALRGVFHAFPTATRNRLDLATLRAQVARHARPHLPDGASTHANGPFVLLGGVHGLAIALLTIRSPHDVLASIRAQGGPDASAVAAIAGTVLGARYGDTWIGAVPARVARWAEGIAGGVCTEDRDTFCRPPD
ncbi:MAG: ADP-ribosylglycohydrolase family protein [Myxococcota bacterium]